MYALQNSYAKWIKNDQNGSCTKKTSHNNEGNEMSYVCFPPCQLNDCTCSSLVENSVIHTGSNDPKHLKKARLKKQTKWKNTYDQAVRQLPFSCIEAACTNMCQDLAGFNNSLSNSSCFICFMLFPQSWKPCLWIPMQTRQNPLENIDWNLGLPWNLLKSIWQQKIEEFFVPILVFFVCITDSCSSGLGCTLHLP